MVVRSDLRPTTWGAVLFQCDACLCVMPENKIMQTAVPRPKGGEPAYVTQCPECGECECFTNVCDEPGCGDEATCGFPTLTGYRRTCGKHYQAD